MLIKFRAHVIRLVALVAWLAILAGLARLDASGPPPAPPQIASSLKSCISHECREDAAADALAYYTEVLAYFTGALAIASVIQGIFLYRADRASKAAFEASTAATKRSMELAEKQFLLEGERADLATKQHGLLRLQHIAANKPLLRIRSIVLVPPVAGATDYFVSGHPVKGSLVVANGGSTDAKIIDSGYRFYWATDGLPMRPPIDDADVDQLLLTEDPIAGFGSRGAEVQSKAALPDIADLLRNNVPGGWKLYLMGFIHYADINGAERFMGFCRRYATPDAFGTEGRFIAVDNTDYEYSD